VTLSGDEADFGPAERKRPANPNAATGVLEENVKLRRTIDELRSSWSWRVTAPIRLGSRATLQVLKMPEKLVKLTKDFGGLKRFASLVRAHVASQGLRKSLALAGQLVQTRQFEFDLVNNYHEEFVNRLRGSLRSKLANLEESTLNRADEISISVVVPLWKPDLGFLKLALESILSQSHVKFEVVLVDDGNKSEKLLEFLRPYEQSDPRVLLLKLEANQGISGASNFGLNSSRGDVVVLMDQDDLLEQDALRAVAVTFSSNQDVVFAYSDEDKVTEDGRYFDPHFKPAFDPILLLSINYISHLSAFRSSFLREVGEFDSFFDGLQDHDFLLRALTSASSHQVAHIPHVLYHWRAHAASTALAPLVKGELAYKRQIAASKAITAVGLAGSATSNLEMPKEVSSNTISLIPRHGGKVSIVIPTRDQFDLLRLTIESIRQRTTYADYEIVVVDNRTEDQDALDFMEHLEATANVKVVRVPEAFNFSKLVNAGVAQSTGKYICLLNNDIEVMSADWMQELVAWAELPGAGAVGARLWFPNQSLQHGGVILGVGGISKVAGHAHKYAQKGAHGYMGRALHHQVFSAVTGACLMVSREKFEQVGGFDQALAVAFNDVDFCLKLSSHGFQNIWSPKASLVHHESASRGIDKTPSQIRRALQEVDLMLSRWGDQLDSDPSYHPLLTHDSEEFKPGQSPHELELLDGRPIARFRAALPLFPTP